jgi:preprotein translocase subunit YajC
MITNLDVLAIIIALGGSMLVMFLFYKQNVAQQKEIRRLRNELRKALKV